MSKDQAICRICDGGPGNEGVCLCGERAYETKATIRKQTDIDALVAAADALAEAVAFWEQAEEPDVSDAIYRLKNAAVRYRAAREAVRKGTPPAFATSA